MEHRFQLGNRASRPVQAARWLALLAGILAGALAVDRLGPRSALGMPSAARMELAGLTMLLDAHRGR
jgi:hypothetical protein